MKQTLKPNKIIFLLLLSTLLLSALLLTACTHDGASVVVVKKADFNVSVTANGELASSNTAFLSPPSVSQMWRYKLTHLVPEGSVVKKGQLVASFESNTIADKHRQKTDSLTTVSKELENLILTQDKQQQDLKVQLAQREVNLRKATRKVSQINQTTAAIEDKKLQLDLQIAKQDMQLYQGKVEGLKSKSALNLSIKQREQQYLTAEVAKLAADLARLQIKAPKDGLFVYASNYEGDKFAVGDTLHTGQTFAEIPSLAKMIVKAKVPERDLARVKQGMAVEIVLDANPQVIYHGKLTRLGSVIREKAKNNPEKVIDTEIEILDPAHDIMRPGMIARLSIVVDSHKDVIVLPSQAISRSNGEATVKMKSLFGEENRPVKVLAFDEQTTALSDGLAVGDEVIL